MDASQVFQIGNSAIILGWILLLAAPNWKLTQPIILKGVIVIYAIVYSYLILKDIGDLKSDSFGTLTSVKALFQNDNAVVAGWFHYLAFDLFVGAYIVREGIKTGMSRWLYSICLPFTLMFGPMGYLIFSVMKLINGKK